MWDSFLIVRDLRLVLDEEVLSPGSSEARFLVEEVLGTQVSSKARFPWQFTALRGQQKNYSLPSSQEAYVVEISPGASQIDVYVPSWRAFINVLETVRQLSQPKEGRLKIPDANVADWPLFQLRGVVEGFYYDPWSWDDRKEVIKRLSMLKMNSYIYAPKHDPYHREKWRESYPKDWMAEFRELASTCKRWHVDFFFALCPGLSVATAARKTKNFS